MLLREGLLVSCGVDKEDERRETDSLIVIFDVVKDFDLLDDTELLVEFRDAEPFFGEMLVFEVDRRFGGLPTYGVLDPSIVPSMVDRVFLLLFPGVPNGELCDPADVYTDDDREVSSIDTKSTIEYDSTLRRGDFGVIVSDLDLLETSFEGDSKTFCIIRLPRMDRLAFGDSGVIVLVSYSNDVAIVVPKLFSSILLLREWMLFLGEGEFLE